ncbi:titin-like [Anneissia japonica]|uniref:titin-like n=1 Tax=Anneissia japonica TaxID=1529436 RepID=UPI0014259ED1|nr:titin-like [Anneissia japonica]
MLSCLSKGTVILETQLPEEMQGIQKTLAYEEALREGTLATEDEASEEDEPAEPVFVKVPEEVKCVEGGPARFSCRLTGYPLPRVSWYKDGVQLIASSRVKISFDGLHHLEIPKTRPYDTGEIKVEAKNKYGQVNYITKLQVLRREDFNIQLRPASREERTKIQTQFEEQRLAAKVGKPATEHERMVPPHAVKQKAIQEEFKPLVQAELITMMEAEPVEVTDAVTVIREPVIEQQPSTVSLPVFSNELKNKVAIEGTPVIFEVRFTGNYETTVRWFKDGVDVHMNPDYSITVTEDTSKLTILESFTDDTGMFSVELGNAAGTVKSEAQLIIQEAVLEEDDSEPVVTETAPKLLTAPQETFVGTCGEPIKIVIKIESEPKSQVTWFKGEHKLVPTIRQKMLEDDNVFTLLILDVKPEDAGTYYCEAFNSSGVCRTEINVVVPASSGAPELVSPMENVEVEEGCPIEIECHAVSKTEPTVTWFLDKAIIKPSKYFQMFYEDGVAKLYINEVFPEDEGLYTCEVENDFGKVSSSARLRVKGMFYDAEYYAS